MANYLITGITSGVGRELTKKLILNGDRVFGIGRRKKLLESLKKDLDNTSKLDFLSIDISDNNAWQKIIIYLKKISFSPDVIIFNAAIFEKDYLNKLLDVKKTRESFEVNFFSIINGFEKLKNTVKDNTQFIFISSSSALKGSGPEGIGYPASKAALSIAFESLYLKYSKKFKLKIIFFGPINTTMSPTKSKFLPPLTTERAVEAIIKSSEQNKVVRYSPWFLFFILKFIKIMPSFVYLTFLRLIDILHLKTIKKH